MILKATDKHSRKGESENRVFLLTPFPFRLPHPSATGPLSALPPRDTLAPPCGRVQVQGAPAAPCVRAQLNPARGARPPSHLSGGVCGPGQPLHPCPRPARPGAAPASFQMDAPEPEITQRAVSDPLSLLFLGRPEAPSAKGCIKSHFESG